MTHSHDTPTPALSVDIEEALRPFADAVFNDNGDMTVTPVYGREAYVNAYFAHKRLTAPNPSPAAKGGDAGAVPTLLSCPFCGGAPTLHPHSPDHKLGAWVSCSTCGLESPTETGRSVEAAVQHWNTRAALATPSPQPADAVRERIARALNSVLGSEEDEHPRHHPAQNSWEKPSEVWWTQWLEAADAVVAALASDPAPAGEAVEPEGPFIVMSSNYSRPFLLGYYETLEQAVKAQCGSPEKWDIFTRQPAPEDTARLREDLERVTRERDALRISHEAVAQDASEMDKALSMAWAVIGSAYDLTLAEEILALMRRHSDKATRLVEVERERDDARKALETVQTKVAVLDGLLTAKDVWFDYGSGFRAHFSFDAGADWPWQAALHGLHAAARSASREGAADPAPATDDRERLVEASDKLVSIVEGIQGIEFGTFRAERNRVRLKDTKEWVEFYLALTRVHAALATEASR